MKKEEILKIVRDSFDYHISTWTGESVLGVESGIDGKEDFFEDLENKIPDDKGGLEARDSAGENGEIPIWKKRDFDFDEVWNEMLRLKGIKE
jgi:hypothetical protein